MKKKLLLAATLCASCGIQAPDGNPVTERQIEAYNKSYQYASMLRVTLKAVVFEDKAYPPYGWTPCGQDTIAFSARWLEVDWAKLHIPGVAAHEACHLYYKDQMRCGSGNSEAVEVRAEQCARDLLVGELPW